MALIQLQQLRRLVHPYQLALREGPGQLNQALPAAATGVQDRPAPVINPLPQVPGVVAPQAGVALGRAPAVGSRPLWLVEQVQQVTGVAPQRKISPPALGIARRINRKNWSGYKAQAPWLLDMLLLMHPRP